MFTILGELKQETEEYHEENRFLDTADLRDVFESNTEKIFRCNVCLKTYAKITSYEAHLKIHNNGDSVLVCHICGAVFTVLNELRIHVTTHSRANMMYPCKMCGHVFHSVLARRKHKLTHLHTPEWTCTACDRKFRQHSFYVDHLHMHKLNMQRQTAQMPLVTTDMSIRFDPEEAIKEEVAIIENPATDIKEYFCGDCGKKCGDLEEMTVHIKSEHLHCPEMSCSGCARRFLHEEDLQQHMVQEHCATEAHTCPVCCSNFSSKNELRKHKAQHNSSNYPCDECGVVFKGRSGVYLHKQRVHRGRRDFACEFCTKQFALKAQRDNHQRVHTGEKPFKCEACGTSFRTQSGLYAHRKTHSDERPYACEVCGKRVRLPYNLRLHMRTHTGEKPYECDICGRAFSQPGDCKKHKNTHLKKSFDLQPAL